MKTTIKIDSFQTLIVEPSPCGGVLLTASFGKMTVNRQTVSPEICAALTNAIRAALEDEDKKYV